MFLLPSASTVWQADLVRVSVVGEFPASLCRHAEPHDSLHIVACGTRKENKDITVFEFFFIAKEKVHALL